MILDPSPTPPILVIGPFGTGKTYALSLACVSILSQPERNKVLICTHSNSAADIHLQHLDTKIRNKPSLRIRPLRVLNIFRRIQTVAEKLRKYCLIAGIFRACVCTFFVVLTTSFPASVFFQSVFNSSSQKAILLRDQRNHFTKRLCRKVVFLNSWQFEKLAVFMV